MPSCNWDISRLGYERADCPCKLCGRRPENVPTGRYCPAASGSQPGCSCRCPVHCFPQPPSYRWKPSTFNPERRHLFIGPDPCDNPFLQPDPRYCLKPVAISLNPIASYSRPSAPAERQTQTTNGQGQRQNQVQNRKRCYN